MWTPHDISIKSKVTAVTVVTCMVALLVASSLLFNFELTQFQERFTADIESIKHITGIYCSGALAFQDQKTAQEILDGLKTQHRIVSASIEDRSGEKFAKVGKETDFSAYRSKASTAGQEFAGGQLIAWQPVMVGNLQVGTVYLCADYRSAYLDLVGFAARVFALVVSASFLIALLISQRLQRLITQPILDLAETSQSVAQMRDYSLRAKKAGKDELGMLTDSFNQMLDQIQTQDTALRREIEERHRAEEQLKQAQEQLITISRQAGMAEVATGVLHNVGNVLNSVNISTSLILETLRRSKIDNLIRASELLKTLPEDDSPETRARARLLPDYLAELSAELRHFHEEMSREAGMLEKNIGHIRDIVAMQQNYARSLGVVEYLSPDVLIDDAVQMNEPALERQEITLERKTECHDLIHADKHKVLQILVNLLRNAIFALQESKKRPREIVVTVSKSDRHHIKIVVSDNGAGIPEENLTRIFSHGFTTRADGHGFGLHSSALAARQMGGTLIATSEGAGRGSQFTLELPVAIKK